MKKAQITIIILVFVLVFVGCSIHANNKWSLKVALPKQFSVKRIYANSQRENCFAILGWDRILRYIVDERIITIAQNVQVGGIISFSGNSIAYIAQDELFIWDTESKKSRKIISIGDDIYEICWLQNDKTILLASGGESTILKKLNIDTGKVTLMIEDQFKYMNPRTCQGKYNYIFFISRIYENEVDSPRGISQLDLTTEKFKDISIPLAVKDRFLYTDFYSISPDGKLLAYKQPNLSNEEKRLGVKNLPNAVQISNISGKLLALINIPGSNKNNLGDISWGKDWLYVVSGDEDIYKIGNR